MQLRRRLIVVGGFFIWASLAAACSKDDGAAPAAFDASYEQPTGRTVVEDVPDGFFNPRDSGVDVPSATTGSPPLGGDGGGPSLDGPQTGDGVNRDAAGRPDTRPDAAPAGCNVIRQDCPGTAQGCYPGGSGAGVCRVAGGRAENVDCDAHDDCLPGLLCVEVIAGGQQACLRACDPSSASNCPGGRGCQSYPSAVLGTCAP